MPLAFIKRGHGRIYVSPRDWRRCLRQSLRRKCGEREDKTLIEEGLFGRRDKAATAIERIQMFEGVADGARSESEKRI
jgi:hypothetical protein